MLNQPPGFYQTEVGEICYKGGMYIYNLNQKPQVEIKLKEAKERFNETSKRNVARSVFTEKIHLMIDTVEFHAQYLTAADKREFREQLQELLKEI